MLVVTVTIEITNVTCFGSDNGVLTLSPSGGNGEDFTFSVCHKVIDKN